MENFFFDYFYYRITQAYFKWDRRNSITAVLAISMFQSMIICDVLLIILRLSYTRSQLTPYSKIIAYIGSGILVAFAIFNYKKYYNKFSSLKSRWKDESKAQRIYKGILILAFLILP